MTVRLTNQTDTQVELNDPTFNNGIRRRSRDESYARDNRIMFSERSHRPERLLPPRIYIKKMIPEILIMVENLPLSSEVISALIGTLLGDASASLVGSRTANYSFTQSTIHIPYFQHVFTTLSASILPITMYKVYQFVDPRSGKTHESITLRVNATNHLVPFVIAFYPTITKPGIRIIKEAP